MTTEVAVNANEASAANGPVKPVRQPAMMANLTVSAALLLPTAAFSATLDGKSVFPLVTEMKARTTVLNEAISSAADEKTRKPTESEAKQVPAQVKKTVKFLTRRLCPCGTATLPFPAWLRRSCPLRTRSPKWRQ